MATPNLVTRDVLATLDAAGVRCEVIDTSAGYTVLRFDHEALDRLGEAVANAGENAEPDWDDCPNCDVSDKIDDLLDAANEFVSALRAAS